ncbi:hypothetical protein KI387_044166 [Taxus chinensis]|uniref:Uncharacterized protein n=1 Tax=Taxus chinensis TaxID=29808 RepID=A0AA38C6N8_TAXCH|nr:hypothetical protein KI387_044166 [Taxus chinensis]
MTSFPSWNSHFQQQQCFPPPTRFTNPPDQHAYSYEQQCQIQFGNGAFQEQEYAYNEDHQMQDVGLLEKIQNMEVKIVQSRAQAQMKAFGIGCGAPYPWVGPFPRHYSPQEKLDFMIATLPLLAKWIEGIEVYERSIQQPCQRVSTPSHAFLFPLSQSVLSQQCQVSNSPSAVPNVESMSPPLSLPPHLNYSFLFPSKQSSPPQELTEIPLPPKKQEVSLPPPPQKIVKPVEVQPIPPLTFPIPCGEEDIEKISHQGQQEEEPGKEEMIKSLVSLALKFGIEKIPLLVKPTEEAKVEQMVVRTDFVAAEEKDLAVPTRPLEQQIEEFELTNFMLEEEFNQEQDCLQTLEEGEAAPNPKEEEHILVVKEKSTYPRGLGTKQATGEPSILLSTSPLSGSSTEEEFDLSNSMLESEANHDDQVADQENTMGEVEHEQQDSNEAVYLSDLEDCFDEEEPVDFSPFSLSSSTSQTPEPAVMKEDFHLQQLASYSSSLESKLEDLNLPCSSLEEEKGQKNSTISSTPSIQEGLQKKTPFLE